MIAKHRQHEQGLLGIPTGDVLIIAQTEGKAHWHNILTWFGKTAYIHGRESILLEIRERIQNKYMEEEDHFTLTLLPTLIVALAAAAMAAALLPLQLSTFSLYSSHSHTSLTQFALLSCCLFIGKNGATSSNSSSTKVAANSSSSSTMVAANLWHLGWVHMVGATPAAAAAIVNGCCTLMATNPTRTRAKSILAFWLWAIIFL